MTPDRDEPMLKSLDLALRVIEALDSGAPEQGVSHLSRQLGTNKTTVYRILTTLEARGYVVQNHVSSRYSIGPRLRRFGQLALARLDLPAVARPFLAELRDRTRETVHLAVLDGADVIYVAKEEGLHAVQVMSTVGDRCPAHCVATGKALLAWADFAVHDQLVASGLARYTPLTHTTNDAFRREMARTRAQGYAVNLGEWRAEVRGTAAPVLDAPEAAIAAIGVCGPSDRISEERIIQMVPLVVDIANRLSLHIGGRSGEIAQLA